MAELIQKQPIYPEDFDKAVFDERGWEFFAEFKRWLHLVRTEKVL